MISTNVDGVVQYHYSDTTPCVHQNKRDDTNIVISVTIKEFYYALY